MPCRLPLLRLGFMVLMAALSGCASSGAGRMTEATSEPRAVDAAAENAAILADLSPGLLLSLQVDGSTVTLADARVAMVPKDAGRRAEGELVTLAGWLAGDRIAEVQVPDQRLQVAERGGLVELASYTLDAAMPLVRAVDTLTVLLPGRDAPSRIDLRSIFADHCRKQPLSPLCPAGEPRR